MQLSQIPARIYAAFASTGSKVNPIPVPSQTGVGDGASASWLDGFPPKTRTLIASGGIPPKGLDMNGVLFMLSAWVRWQSAGGGSVYDGTFAADSNVGGYPKGARVLRADGTGYWLNQADNNTTDPDAGGAGWVPDLNYGITAITGLTNANVTLTALQYSKSIITLSGTLTGNVQIIFPALVGEWTVVNNTTGAFTVTCKTASGGGAIIAQGAPASLLIGDGTNISATMSDKTTSDAMYNTGRLIGVRVFTNANTASTYVPPAGIGRAIVEVQAPGGGSGGAAATGSGGYSGSPGASSGSYAKCMLTAAQIGSGQVMTIPAGGAAGASGSSTGGNGSTASFGSLISCPGGIGSTSYGPTAGVVTIVDGPALASAPSTTGTVIASTRGNKGQGAVGSTGGGVLTPIGGAPAFGGTSYGAGSDGASLGASSSAMTGAKGGDAYIVIWEYA
jgi:hypothetical protein